MSAVTQPGTATAARVSLFALFAISGFSGLIYESVWAQYLKLLLGHAAYAQTLVLIIFMGGMALGSWLAARRTLGWRNLLLGYAVVEVIIGLAGVLFHIIFSASMDIAHGTLMPAIGEPTLVAVFKWSLAAALVLPQSVLLGMSFPLMSGAVVRRFPGRAGDTVSMLYFTNSIGAALGVLASGFVMVPALGLPGTVLTAGFINIGLALVVWLMSKEPVWQREPRAGDGPGAEPRQAPYASPTLPSAALGVRLLLGVSFATGLASFVYEIGWIRMLSLVLGASTHAFELMLSAFILGLALGSLWVRRRIDGLRDPLTFLGVVQVVMGILALGTLLVYGSTFELMAGVLQALQRNDAGYLLFNVASHGIAMLVMLPVTFCAGMTLPLITTALLRGALGERSIGHVYAANTVGAIAGVVLAVHLLMPWLGLKGLICVGAAVDIAAGTVLLLRGHSHARLAWPAAGVAALVATLVGVQLDVHRMVSGVFRYGRLDLAENVDVLLHADGKTATVNLVGYANGIVGIMTNGKTDASMQLRDDSDEISSDELTMTMAAALSVAARPQARNVAVIGFGAGMSTHVVLGADSVQQVDTIEIEPRMFEAARIYERRVWRAFDDRRSRVHFEDARTFFSTAQRRYDIILSEPSNPWVSGIATLFTEEFYHRAHASLTDDGLFVQWIHGLEISMPLISTVARALGNAFDDYALYNLNGRDLMFIAGPRGRVGVDAGALLAMPGLETDLQRIGVRHPRDVDMRYLGSRSTLEPLLLSYPAQPNSDYYPVLDNGAVRARFLRQDAADLFTLRRLSLPVIDILEPGAADRPAEPMTPIALFDQADAVRAARLFADSLGDDLDSSWRGQLPDWLTELRLQGPLLWATCGQGIYADDWQRSVGGVRRLVGLLPADSVQRITEAMAADGCVARWTAVQKLQVGLLNAIAARDTLAMATLSRQLLEHADFTDLQGRRDAIAALLLALLGRDQPREARAMDQAFAASARLVETDTEIRLLRTLAYARAR